MSKIKNEQYNVSNVAVGLPNTAEVEAAVYPLFISDASENVNFNGQSIGTVRIVTYPLQKEIPASRVSAEQERTSIDQSLMLANGEKVDFKNLRYFSDFTKLRTITPIYFVSKKTELNRFAGYELAQQLRNILAPVKHETVLEEIDDLDGDGIKEKLITTDLLFVGCVYAIDRTFGDAKSENDSVFKSARAFSERVYVVDVVRVGTIEYSKPDSKTETHVLAARYLYSQSFIKDLFMSVSKDCEPQAMKYLQSNKHEVPMDLEKEFNINVLSKYPEGTEPNEMGRVEKPFWMRVVEPSK